MRSLRIIGILALAAGSACDDEQARAASPTVGLWIESQTSAKNVVVYVDAHDAKGKSLTLEAYGGTVCLVGATLDDAGSCVDGIANVNVSGASETFIAVFSIESGSSSGTLVAELLDGPMVVSAASREITVNPTSNEDAAPTDAGIDASVSDSSTSVD